MPKKEGDFMKKLLAITFFALATISSTASAGWWWGRGGCCTTGCGYAYAAPERCCEYENDCCYERGPVWW